jgi:competence protein ComEC
MVALAFFTGGALLAADAWRQAWRPSLRTAFEARAGDDSEAVSIAVTGILRADAAARERGVSLSLQATSMRPQASEASSPADGLPADSEIAVEGGVLLTVAGALARERMSEWRAGRLVRVQAQLRRPTRYRNPGAPDEERALARRGTTLVGSVKSGLLVEVLADGNHLSEAAATGRAFVRRSLAAAVGGWSTQSAAIVTAIVIGDRAGLSTDAQRRLQEAGTYHVVAISGGNIAILAALALALFRVSGSLGPGAMASAMLALIAYCYLVGGGASVERATAMAVIFFAGRVVDLRGPPLNAVAVTSTLLVAAQPLAVADAAFLLTFGATIGLLVLVPVVSARRLPRLATAAVMLLSASVAAEMALLPVGAWFFSRVTIAGLALNLVAIPLMAVVQIGGLLVLAATPVSTQIAAVIGWMVHVAAAGLLRSADLLEAVPVLAWRVAPPSAPAVMAYYGGLVAWWALAQRRKVISGSAENMRWRRVRIAAAATACGAAIWIAAEPWTFIAARGDGLLHATFIDVGQGDAILVRFPRGSALLVDAGGQASSFDIGDRVVAPVLRHAGIRRLAWLVLTHGHGDHVGGAPSILREFAPRDVWEGVPVPSLRSLQQIQATADDVSARWVTVQAGDRLVVDGVELHVRHPGIPDWERQAARNDDSVVLELLWHDVSILLAGDIGRDVEREVALRLAPARIRVVKVPHHGSATSSTKSFVDALAADVAVVTAGAGNAFGHPSADVLTRYRDGAAEIFRTDRDGAVTVVTDGRMVRAESFEGRVVTVP